MNRETFWDCVAVFAVFLVTLGVLMNYGPDFSQENATRQAYKWCESVRGLNPEGKWVLSFSEEALPGCTCGRLSYIVDKPFYCCCDDVKGDVNE